jgi:hypothetical protein
VRFSIVTTSGVGCRGGRLPPQVSGASDTRSGQSAERRIVAKREGAYAETVLVPADFDAPRSFDGPGFRLEPLGAEHNERDHVAWMSSIDHIRSTPGLDAWEGQWPTPMTPDDNLADLVRHRAEFEARAAFA